jgi:EF-P beta-lysylation protein EpmB
MHSVPLWRQIQKENFTHWETLLAFLKLESDRADQILLKKAKFSLNIPKRLVQKIVPGNWNDPILLQFLPTLKELETSPLFVQDPVGDGASRKKPKLLHKYHGRALLVCTSACAMHCRYCFRQHFDYETSNKLFQEELAEIAKESSLSEILLSGGDPLSLSDLQLGELLESLDQIPHLKRIRFHTRFPMGIPERIDAQFLKLLASRKKQIIFLIHCNHPAEFDVEILQQLKKVQQLGIPVLSQSVLLKNVNDDVAVLRDLFLLLVDNGILPYYLHQLDRVQGAVHFEVPEEKGKQLMAQLERILPGYAIPKYVREIPGQPQKTPIF